LQHRSTRRLAHTRWACGGFRSQEAASAVLRHSCSLLKVSAEGIQGSMAAVVEVLGRERAVAAVRDTPLVLSRRPADIREAYGALVRTLTQYDKAGLCMRAQPNMSRVLEEDLTPHTSMRRYYIATDTANELGQVEAVGREAAVAAVEHDLNHLAVKATTVREAMLALVKRSGQEVRVRDRVRVVWRAALVARVVPCVCL
jgi:hypothetical protein